MCAVCHSAKAAELHSITCTIWAVSDFIPQIILQTKKSAVQNHAGSCYMRGVQRFESGNPSVNFILAVSFSTGHISKSWVYLKAAGLPLKCVYLNVKHTNHFNLAIDNTLNIMMTY